MNPLDPAVARTAEFLEHATSLHAQYRAGQIHVHVPEGLSDGARALEDLVSEHLPASHAALQAASRGLFFSLPVAFDASESIGPYLAIVDRDPAGEPYRFLDMGALIATHPSAKTIRRRFVRFSTRCHSSWRATRTRNIRPCSRCR